ncbi:TetR family transcriptional regulator, partial [Psychrobacter sp. T6-1]
MSSREQKKLQTRHAFFNAVLDLCMMGQSFSSISLRQVTREVGVVPTAFYRHFDDMESLGQALVDEELGSTFAALSSSLQIGRKRSFDRQIAKSIQLFLQTVSAQPRYWQFLVSERFGGSEAVRKSISELMTKHGILLADDLALQPAFAHINIYDLRLLAAAGLNMFFSWIIDWLDLTYSEDHDDEVDLGDIEEKKQLMLHNCTRQAQMLFYGA